MQPSTHHTHTHTNYETGKIKTQGKENRKI